MTRYDGLEEHALEGLTGAPRVVVREQISSALDLAHALGEGGAPGGTVVLADEQTAGRGRMGRTWHSPRGAGVWLAVLLRPLETPAGGALAIRAGLATIDAIAEVAPPAAPQLKWPNDILVDGRKVGGVLCEARWNGERLGWVAVGIGINVHGPLHAEVAERAIALADVHPGVTRPALLGALVPRLLVLAGRPAELEPAERAAAFGRLHWQAGDEGPDVVGIDGDGVLLVRGPDGSLDRCPTAP